MIRNFDLSPNFSFHEAVRTDRRGFLTMNREMGRRRLPRIALLAQTVLQPIRDHLKLPMKTSSWYRCPELNRAVGGVKWSDHVDGAAWDGWIKGLHRNRKEMWEVFDSIRGFVKAKEIMFGQIILEEKNSWKGPGLWLHISQGAPSRDLKKCGEVWTYLDGTYTFVEKIPFPRWER